MSIKLTDILPIENLHDYKLHLACWNGEDNPLDVFVRSKEEWEGWNTWRGQKDDFSREYIFSLIDFYPEPEIWLFGGIYKVRKYRDTSHIIFLLHHHFSHLNRTVRLSQNVF